MKITGMKTCYQRNPLGIDLADLTFSWQVEEAVGSAQKHARLVIAKDPDFRSVVFDSDRDDKERQGILPSGCYTPEVGVHPGEPYFWKVSVEDDAGDLGESPVQTFEGGHPEGPWGGSWIAPSFTREIHPVMRKTFLVTGEELRSLKRARLYLCGLGLYEAYVNGKKIGDQFLTPYFTDYRYWVQYQTYDIADLLQEGENTLDVWLGEGWYKGRFGYLSDGQLREYYGDTFRMIADLYLFGSAARRISTDGSWKCLRSPVVKSGIYDGEWLDLRREEVLRHPTQGEIAEVITVTPPAAQLHAMVGVPVRAHETLTPCEVITTPRGETVLDFGQEVTGWVEFAADLPAETEVTLEYGEVLQGGNFYRDNLRTAEAKFTCTFAGKGKVLVRPHFTFYGFRYVRVTGMQVTGKNAKDFTAVCLYSDLEETGEVITGIPKVNRLIANTKWSQKDNFLDIPTDCPQRDERLGWTGDAEIFADTASCHMETPRFYRKYLRDMNLEQREKNGAVPYVVPDVLTVGREKQKEPPFALEKDQWGEAGAAVWGDAATIIPWTVYLHYGNKKLLAESYPGMRQWVDFIRSMDETYCGGKRLWTCGFHFGDWLSLDVEGDAAGMDNREGGTDKQFVASVFYFYSASLTARAAEALGRQEEAKAYAKLAGEVYRALQGAYVTGEGTLSIDTQTAYALGICFDLFETEEGKRLAGDHLAELLHRNHDHLSTGFVGTAYLCRALTQTGHGREAVTLLLNEDYPSWLYEVNLGATTIWERWNSLLADGSISGTGMNSLNHYAYGCVCGWIYEDLCGLRVTKEGIGAGNDGIGARTLKIAPHTDARLGRAQARIRFPQGQYCAGWQIGDGTPQKEDGQEAEKPIAYHFFVPFDGKAVFVPDRALRNLTVNGTPITREELSARIFGAGTYEIKGEPLL